MGWNVSHWVRVLTAGLMAQACGCSSSSPSSDPEPIPQVEPLPAKEQPPLEPGATQSPPQDSEEALSCADIHPIGPGPGRTIALLATAQNFGYHFAQCGPGTSDGAGYLALMNNADLGVVLWSVVSPSGVPRSELIGGGDLAWEIVPQPSGFQVSINAEQPPGLLMTSYSSQGVRLNQVRLTKDTDAPYSLFPNPQGGSLLATWEPREGNAQAVMYQFLDSTGVPRSERVELLSAPWAGDIHLIGGVDTHGRALLMWQEPRHGDGWVAQWVARDGGPITQPFRFLLTGASGELHPLAGGGLALRNGAGQWIASFPSGKPSMEPAPAWLADHPGTALVLIHGQRAHALVLPPSEIPGTGCQAALLTFTQDGTACGKLLFPAVEGSCGSRQINIGLDGSVIQQLAPIVGQHCERDDPDCIPGDNNDDQCVWRWWPRLLH
jgi:hypothetical protein